MTGLLVSAPIPTVTGEYQPIPETGIGLTLLAGVATVDGIK